MEPLTIAALALGGAKLAGNVVSGIGQYQALGENEAITDRIKELERLQEADALGLTGEEKQAYVQAFMNPQRAIAAEQMSQAQALQAMSQDSGEAMRRLRAAEEQQQRAQGEAGRQIQMLDMQKAQAQEDELLQLSIADEQRAAAQKAALFNLIGGGVSDVGSLVGQTMMAQEMVGKGSGQYNAMQLQQLGAMYGYQFPTYASPAQQPFTQGMPQQFYGQYPMYQPGYQQMAPPNFYGTNLQTGTPVDPGTGTGGSK